MYSVPRTLPGGSTVVVACASQLASCCAWGDSDSARLPLAKQGVKKGPQRLTYILCQLYNCQVIIEGICVINSPQKAPRGRK